MPRHGKDASNPRNEQEPNDSDNAPLENDGWQIPGFLNVEDVVGVSIGEKQSHLKSPRTPAIEKTQALEKSEDYFVDSPDLDEAPADSQTDEAREQAVEISKRPSDSGAASPVKDEIALPPKLEADQQKQPPQRSETSRSFLRDTLATSRKRASSGSAIITENIRRLVPDVSLPPWLTDSQSKSYTRSIKWATLAQTDRITASPKRGSSFFPPSMVGSSPRPTRDESSVDESLTASPSEDTSSALKLKRESSRASSRSQNLRRVTSDSSLFLRRQNTASTSGSGQWDHVHEQVNSRVKAIRDSFQDSGFRLPKLSNFSIGSFTPPSPQKTENAVGNPSKDFARNPELPSIKPGNSAHDTRTTRDYVSFRPPLQRYAINGPQKSGRPILADALTGLSGDVVVLGGYRGSILRSADPPHRQVWVPVKVGLNIRRVDLEVGLTTEDEDNVEKKIIPSGVLSHIGPIDICRRLLKKLHKCSNAQTGKLRVHNYGYDWRLNPHILSRKLIEFLEGLQCNKSGTKDKRGAIIIAHSLGGLITRHAVNQRPELFAGVLYAGVPQHCVNILGPLRNGDEVLLSSKVLTAQVNFTIRTSFVLLPENGICFFDKETNERYDVDFFDARTWDHYRLSPCIYPPLLRKPREKPAGIIETVSSTVSSSFASLASPVKRLSWATGGEAATKTTNDSLVSKVKDTARSAGDQVSQIGQVATSPTRNVEPTIDAHRNTRAPTIATACTIPRAAAMEYLQRTLAEVLRFKRELACKEELQVHNEYPPAAVLYSRNTPTVSGARVAGRDAIKYSDAYDDLSFAAGDGVVLARAAMLPEGYRIVKNGLVKSDRGHVGLLGDLEGVGSCLRALIDGRKRGVGLGK